jgi:hypothetical protein
MQNWWATKRNKKLSFNTCMFTYKWILCFNLLSIEIKISWNGPPSPYSGMPDMLLTWHFSTVLLYMCVHPEHRAEWTSLVCNICNKHNVPVSISQGKRTQYDIRDEIVVPISFFSLRKLHLFPQTSWNWQKRAVYINYSGSNKKWIDRFLL